ncbi:peptidoglycan D,D-transpeptidase FtsI family protein [Alcanivorax quisquiliarum]|uniref:Peptidoglycan D,D-transpeptidase FtsI n=1 Tax=Alcanivorax quisquiliarum TaxID=2933565 RepID=A0ABT0E7Y3_9GAMM|nr:penicillin-binding transpeptidase domain-containing protein [Alcanivorax quisquiliarum]MCK0537946.1 penicillin-binding protein 2 [Alcanivorax quisquiliarum]
MSGARRQGKQAGYSARRLRVVLAFLAAGALLLGWRAVDLHVMQHEFLARQGELRNLRIEPLAAHRGVITDRANRPLAVSTPVTTLWANPREVLAAREQWSKLTGNPVVDSRTLAQRVEANASREFIYLARHLAPEQAQQVLAQKVPGIYPLTEYRRYYPAGEVTSHLVGFTNIDDVGQEGIELSMDARLRGQPGRKRVVRDLHGRVIQDIAVLQEAHPGSNVALSIDLRLQYLAYRELLAAVTRNQATGGSAVVLDARTGEVLAMVNQPAYNPNNRAGVQTAALRNRAITDVFEPGSTIKPLTVAAALESGLVNVSSTVDTRPGTIRVANKTIRDYRNYGVIDIATVLTKSSNVGTTKLALAMDDQVLPGFMERFGFGLPTAIPFPGESSGMMPIRTRWRDIETAALSYGYGVSVTALQLARAYAVIANGGVKLPLSLEKVEQPPQGERIISEAHANALVNMLESVISEGTARRASVPGYRVAGKTGTVHKLTTAGYADDRYMALFAGFAPADDPRIVTVVVVDDPRGEAYFGGLVAAPVFSNIMAGVLRMLNFEPEQPAGIYAGVGGEEGRI